MTAKLTSDLDRALSDLELRCLQLENQADDLRSEINQMRNQHSAAMAQAREAEPDTLEDVASVIGCTPANVAERVEEILRENRDLLMERHGLRSEGLKLAEENERLRLSCREASLADGWMPRALHRAERECDEARAENVALKAALTCYVANDDTREDGGFAVYNAALINNKRRAMRLLGLLEDK